MSQLDGRVVLGRYRVLSLLARGGMGEVYLARSEGSSGFHRPVVVKRILSEHANDKLILSLFQREARIMASLRHPNIVSVLDFGRDLDDHVMAIEYVHGFHLGRWLRWLQTKGEHFPVERAIQIMLYVLEALQHAHEARGPDGSPLGIVHRDISPGNVLIDVEGTVKLADFGVARMQGEHTVVDGAEPAIRGKFPYLPPELFSGALATVNTDVYGAAVVLDEILRGVNPFRAPQMAETLSRVMEHVPLKLHAERSDVSSELADVVARAISKVPEERYQTAAELAAALRAVRTVSPDQAKRELEVAAKRDFTDPEIAYTLDLPDLAVLEAQWHAAVPISQPPDRPDVTKSTLKTGLGKRPVEVPGRGPPYLAISIGAAIAILGGAIAYAFLRPPPLEAGGPVFVVVDRTVDAGSTGAAPPPVIDVGRSIDAGAPHAPDAGRTPRAGRAGVEAPFRARAGEINRCFTTNVTSLEGSPELVVHFELAADGSVIAARVSPDAIGATALGACLRRVAESTRFVGTGAPIAFRVPLGARRVGGP